MSARVTVQMADGWQGHLREAEWVFLDTALGPDMVADARRYVPIDTSRLHDSLDHAVVDAGDGVPQLQVGSFPDDEGEVEYALAVEFGFHGEEVVREHVVHRGFKDGDVAVGHVVREHVRHANQPEEPYLRPALYQERY